MPVPTAGTELFTAADLTNWLGRAVVDSKAKVVERVVWGWLKAELGRADRPYPVPDEVFAWAVELGAIAHENPSGLSRKQLGPGQQDFSSERRLEILAAAAAYDETAPSGSRVVGPQGSFPPAPAYPDPARW